ncbi:spermine oxidase-like [Diachasmimorpha longicaudata]|uniref:spermine oxidase-like n=1 Tax=Diachasmimorpha longicaudata TaxID=58733 RepID=UPI0030B8FE81
MKSESKEMRGLKVERTRVAIVGAGIAGLAAAKTLEDHQFYEYIMLEAQDYVGGRIKSICWNDDWIEEGAQFIHGGESEFAKFCAKHNLISEEESTEGKGIYVRNDGMQLSSQLIEEISHSITDILEDCEKYTHYDETRHEEIPESIGSHLKLEIDRHIWCKGDLSNKNLKQSIVDWNYRFFMIDNACSKLEELSARYWGQFRTPGGPEHLVFRQGYSSVVDLISKGLKNENLRLNSPVKRIKWGETLSTDSAPIVLTLEDRKVLADCVIVTCSLGFLKEHHEEIFEPSLPPNLVLAIKSLGFGLINKVFLDFGEAWWTPGIQGFQLIWHEDNKASEMGAELAAWTRDLTGFDVLENHEAVLVGWVGGRGAELIENLTEEEVGNDCIDLLKVFLKRETLPAPKRCKRSQWGKKKWVRGSYSHISTTCDGTRITPKNLASPVWREIRQKDQVKHVPAVMFAGEAAHECYYSTTHGAYDSGRSQAFKFLRYHVWD